ncbi:hypothetical protein [Sphingobium bisphenolivorans]|uniref:hypothetical protein n=1 Tax=Sphingobium bisphenolivorans TaxID=1335760 RepID=UPI0003A0BD3B|nr:hypothetical protein [Sphingobium bisphenolivorans]
MWHEAVARHLERWSGAVKRELFRDPHRVLLDHVPDQAVGGDQSRHAEPAEERLSA